jgi:sodium/potassium-transporting ATPase subunit alpha
VYLCRSDRGSALGKPWLDNRLILAGLAVELALILAIDYTTIGNGIFGTAPIPAAVWLLIAPFAAAMLVLEEGRKGVVRSLISGRGRVVRLRSLLRHFGERGIGQQQRARH